MQHSQIYLLYVAFFCFYFNGLRLQLINLLVITSTYQSPTTLITVNTIPHLGTGKQPPQADSLAWGSAHALGSDRGRCLTVDAVLGALIDF